MRAACVRVSASSHPFGTGPRLREDQYYSLNASGYLITPFAALTFLNMVLLRGLFWLVLFIVLTFCFVVLFEHGPKDFVNGARKEYRRIRSFVAKQTETMRKPKKEG